MLVKICMCWCVHVHFFKTLIFRALLDSQQNWVKYRDFPSTPPPPSTSPPDGTLVITGASTWTHQHHPNSVVDIRVTFAVVQSTHLDKCRTTCIPHYFFFFSTTVFQACFSYFRSLRTCLQLYLSVYTRILKTILKVYNLFELTKIEKVVTLMTSNSH